MLINCFVYYLISCLFLSWCIALICHIRLLRLPWLITPHQCNFFHIHLYYLLLRSIKHQSRFSCKSLIYLLYCSIDSVLKCLEKTGAKCTNLDIKGVELKTSKVEDRLNIELLEENSSEWGAEHYLKWRDDSEFSYCVK